MTVSELRNFAARHLTGLIAGPLLKGASRLGAPTSPIGGLKAPAPRPTMELEHWGTILEVSQARVGDRFTLGRLRFRTDDGVEGTFTIERGNTYMSFNWLDDRGAWQRKRAAFHELKPGMRAEVRGEAGVADLVLVEGLPRVTA